MHEVYLFAADINECTELASEGPLCLNGGECRDTSTGYTCDCPNNFVGERCEICKFKMILKRMKKPSSTGPLPVNFFVRMEWWYQKSTTKHAENNISATADCGGFPCRNGGMCQYIDGEFSCDCTPGWTGRQCDDGERLCFAVLQLQFLQLWCIKTQENLTEYVANFCW